MTGERARDGGNVSQLREEAYEQIEDMQARLDDISRAVETGEIWKADHETIKLRFATGELSNTLDEITKENMDGEDDE